MKLNQKSSHYSIGKFSSENKKLFCFQTPSLVPKWVGRFGRFFSKKFFAQNTKTAEKPDIRLLLAELNGDESEIAGAAAALAEDVTSPLESAADCINSILYDKYSERIRQLAALSEAEADKAKRAELLHEQMNLMLKLRKT